MTAYALFSALYYPIPTYVGPQTFMVFSSDRFNVTCPGTGDGPGLAWVGSPQSTGKYRFQWQYGQVAGDNPGGQAFMGFANEADLASFGSYPANAVGISSNGNMYTTNGAGAQTLYNAFGTPLSPGDYVLGVYNAATQQVWMAIYYAATSTLTNWNGYPLGNPDTGVDGLTVSNITKFVPVVMAQLGLTQGGVYINSGQASYQPGMPTTFSNLPATLELLTGPTAYKGQVGTFTWLDSNCGTLQYILDGGAAANAAGTTTGAGGTATTVGTFAAVQSHSFILTDGANLIDQTPSVPFWTPPNPGGDVVLFSQRGTFQGSGTGTKTATATFGAVDQIEFTYLLNEVDSPLTSGITFDPGMNLYVDNTFSSTILSVSAGDSTGGTVTGQITLGVPGTLPTSGSNSWTVTGAWGTYGDIISSLVAGTVTVNSIVSGQAFGDVVVTHPSGSCTWTAQQLTFGASLTGTACIQAWGATCTTGFLDYGVALYGAAGEAITLNGPINGTPSVPLPLSGTITGATALGMDYQVNGAGAWTTVGSYLETGTAFTGTGPTYSGATSGTIMVRDSGTLVESNSVSFSISAQNRVSQVVEQVALRIPAQGRVSQVVEQVVLSIPEFGRVGLYRTDVLPPSTAVYTEFGAPMLWNYQTALLPDNQQQRNNAMIITTLDLAFIGNTPIVGVQFLDSAQNILQQSSVVSNGAVSVWNGTPANSTWNEVPWNGVAAPLSPYQIGWAAPITFKQGIFAASGTSCVGFKIGTLYLEYQVLGYVAQLPSGRV